MFVRKILGPLFFLISVAAVFSQDNNKDNKRKVLTVLAKEHIKTLHDDGALLVRLMTKKNAIEALRKQGNDKAADKLQKEQDALNKSIIKAFKAEYTFSPVYFFFSENSKDILENNMGAVTFLNEDLQPDKNIVMDRKKFLTAEFSSFNAGGQNGTALLVMDEKFNKLKRPFPFFVRIYDGLPFERKPASVVKKLQLKLDKFYKKQ